MSELSSEGRMAERRRVDIVYTHKPSHTHTYTYTHARTHTHTHAHTHTHIYIYMYTHTHKYIYTYIIYMSELSSEGRMVDRRRVDIEHEQLLCEAFSKVSSTGSVW